MQRLLFLLFILPFLPFSRSTAQLVLEPLDENYQPTNGQATYYRSVSDTGQQFKIVDFYPSGKKHRSGIASDISPLVWNGTLTWFRERGSMLKREQYQDGELNGLVETFYARGQRKMIAEYLEGEEIGRTLYLASGEKVLEIRDGSMQKWDAGGQMTAQYSRKTGLHTLWDQYGHKIAEGPGPDYLNREGAWKFWFSSGNLRASGQYKNDLKSGEWVYFKDEDGERELLKIEGQGDRERVTKILLNYAEKAYSVPRLLEWPGEISDLGMKNLVVIFKGKSGDPAAEFAYQEALLKFEHVQKYWENWSETPMETKQEGLRMGTAFITDQLGSLAGTGKWVGVKIYLADFPEEDESFVVVEFIKG